MTTGAEAPSRFVDRSSPSRRAWQPFLSCARTCRIGWEVVTQCARKGPAGGRNQVPRHRCGYARDALRHVPLSVGPADSVPSLLGGAEAP